MNSVEFGRILENQMQRTIDILDHKAGEYATDDERLHNFKVIAELQGITLRQAVVNLMAKHTLSVFDMAMSRTVFTREQWDEKITDHINYLILLQAVLEEERKGDAEKSKSADELRRDFPPAR